MELAAIQQRWQQEPAGEYQCDRTLNLYKTTTDSSLATQAATGRSLQITDITSDGIRVRLCADEYPGWLRPADAVALSPSPEYYQAPTVTRAEIEHAIPVAIAFTQAAMATPNHYLWGGTVAPNYDCSGLMQAAFMAAGVPIPRDSYQQEAFTTPIEQSQLRAGDLIFFGPPERATHVALHLENGRYIHSSGRDQGRNGIGIDSLIDVSHPVSATYAAQYRGCGRIMVGYQPQKLASAR